MTVPPNSSRPTIDTRDFTRSASRTAGACAIAGLGRLADLLADTQGDVRWELAGESARRADGGSDAHLALSFGATLRMGCVRCLEPVAVQVDERRHYRMVVSESIAEREDLESEDFDLLCHDPRLDVLDLLEDEVIMALPIAPRHADCQPPAEAGAPAAAAGDDDGQERVHPFAALASLRRGPGEPGSRG
jgi:uncharacterized protein